MKFLNAFLAHELYFLLKYIRDDLANPKELKSARNKIDVQTCDTLWLSKKVIEVFRRCLRSALKNDKYISDLKVRLNKYDMVISFEHPAVRHFYRNHYSYQNTSSFYRHFDDFPMAESFNPLVTDLTLRIKLVYRSISRTYVVVDNRMQIYLSVNRIYNSRRIGYYHAHSSNIIPYLICLTRGSYIKFLRNIVGIVNLLTTYEDKIKPILEAEKEYILQGSMDIFDIENSQATLEDVSSLESIESFVLATIDSYKHTA